MLTAVKPEKISNRTKQATTNDVTDSHPLVLLKL